MANIFNKKRKIAAGHDNIEDLLPFHSIDPCLFQDYKRWINTEWNSEESIELNGDARYVAIGKAWEAILFPVLTIDERAYIRSLTNGLDGLVTYETFNQDELEWITCNGTLSIVDETFTGADYRNVRVEIRDLTEI